MKTIHQYQVFTDAQTQKIATPPGSFTPRHLDFQGGSLCLWAEVEIKNDPTSNSVDRMVTRVGTGWAVPECLTYVGTAQEHSFVWHIYVDCRDR